MIEGQASILELSSLLRGKIVSRGEQGEATRTWWTYPVILPRFAFSLFLILVAGVLLMSVVEFARGDGNGPVDLILPALLVLCAGIYGAAVREHTRVGCAGIEVVLVRRRRIAWQEIATFRSEPPGKWSTRVRAELTDGHRVSLVAVPPEDLDELLRFRPVGPSGREEA